MSTQGSGLNPAYKDILITLLDAADTRRDTATSKAFDEITHLKSALKELFAETTKSTFEFKEHLLDFEARLLASERMRTAGSDASLKALKVLFESHNTLQSDFRTVLQANNLQSPVLQRAFLPSDIMTEAYAEQRRYFEEKQKLQLADSQQTMKELIIIQKQQQESSQCSQTQFTHLSSKSTLIAQTQTEQHRQLQEKLEKTSGSLQEQIQALDSKEQASFQELQGKLTQQFAECELNANKRSDTLQGQIQTLGSNEQASFQELLNKLIEQSVEASKRHNDLQGQIQALERELVQQSNTQEKKIQILSNQLFFLQQNKAEAVFKIYAKIDDAQKALMHQLKRTEVKREEMHAHIDFLYRSAMKVTKDSFKTRGNWNENDALQVIAALRQNYPSQNITEHPAFAHINLLLNCSVISDKTAIINPAIWIKCSNNIINVLSRYKKMRINYSYNEIRVTHCQQNGTREQHLKALNKLKEKIKDYQSFVNNLLKLDQLTTSLKDLKSALLNSKENEEMDLSLIEARYLVLDGFLALIYEKDYLDKKFDFFREIGSQFYYTNSFKPNVDNILQKLDELTPYLKPISKFSIINDVLKNIVDFQKKSLQIPNKQKKSL